VDADPVDVEPVDVEDEPAEGVVEGCCSVVAVELVVFPWDVSAATNENSPARPTEPAIIQRLMRESIRRPRSRVAEVRVGEVRGSVMAPMVGATRKRTLSGR
jgi:hypothetical protein